MQKVQKTLIKQGKPSYFEGLQSACFIIPTMKPLDQ